MIFSFLLWLAAWQIRIKLFFVFKKHPDIRAELSSENISIQVQTLNKSSLRCFTLQNAKFNSFKQELENPSIKVIFPNGKIAREVMKAIRQDKNQIFTFIQEQKINIEGDFSVLQKLFLIKEKLNEDSDAT